MSTGGRAIDAVAMAGAGLDGGGSCATCGTTAGGGAKIAKQMGIANLAGTNSARSLPRDSA